ncbi:MAG TPA: bifunctional 4-hydroxy-2-oxoglutarate aldolase/2-dehydro-3-deoxy-phosphogluconate aldolase, partial [Pilimelia sp.]|nr:bifunctional 4-hydroxy-2-oxoglutarate aldolase/2-dehydro-3-deoxy-phosphogluconate aldolase [Pilimelia sp.]
PGPALTADGVLAVLRAPSGGPPAVDRIVAASAALVRAGVRCVEVTLNSPGALEALRAVRTLVDGVELGAGTVLRPGDVTAAAAAGAQYVVSPHTDPEIGARARELGLPWYPGALTPTEVATAWRLGATAVKLFPASLGGPRYLRELRGPLPGVALLPTGGVDADTAGEFVRAGACAVGAGGWLLGDALTGRADGTDPLVALAERARRLRDAVAAARGADPGHRP